jgi:hypothetical protein
LELAHRDVGVPN